jgi:hypothetical protein
MQFICLSISSSAPLPCNDCPAALLQVFDETVE